MKVLLITRDTHLNSGWGRQIAMTVREYDSLNVSYTILTESRDITHSHETNLLRPYGSLVSILHNLYVTWRLGRTYDVVHAFDVWPYGLYAFAGVVGRKSSLFLNGIGTYSVAPLYAPFKRLILRIVFARTKKIFCISTYTKQEMIRAMPLLSSKTEVVHMGTTVLPVPSREAIDALRGRLGITGAPIILSVGAIKDRKGQFDTLQAVALLKNKYPRIQYIVVGSTGDRHYVAQMNHFSKEHGLENNLLITDSIHTDEDLASLYSMCDVFALNSNNDTVSHHFEGFGLVFLEAYQFGKSAVGSRNCGIEDAIEDGVTGFLCEQGDSVGISIKLDQLLNRAPDAFSAKIRSFREGFSWKKTAEKYLRSYQESVQS